MRIGRRKKHGGRSRVRWLVLVHIRIGILALKLKIWLVWAIITKVLFHFFTFEFASLSLFPITFSSYIHICFLFFQSNSYSSYLLYNQVFFLSFFCFCFFLVLDENDILDTKSFLLLQSYLCYLCYRIGSICLWEYISLLLTWLSYKFSSWIFKFVSIHPSTLVSV